MADTATATATPAAAAPKRNKVSEREYINAAGDLVERIELATGARYILGEKQGDKFVPVATFDLQCGTPGNFVTMNAIMGFHTKAGNVANTVLNDKENPGTLAQAADAIKEWIADGANGKWAERTGGGGGLRYDPAVVADAIAAAKGETDPAPYLAKMDWRVDAKGQQVAPDAKGEYPKGAISYAAYAMRNAKVKAEYDKRKGSGVDLGAL